MAVTASPSRIVSVIPNQFRCRLPCELQHRLAMTSQSKVRMLHCDVLLFCLRPDNLVGYSLLAHKLEASFISSCDQHSFPHHGLAVSLIGQSRHCHRILSRDWSWHSFRASAARCQGEPAMSSLMHGNSLYIYR